MEMCKNRGRRSLASKIGPGKEGGHTNDIDGSVNVATNHPPICVPVKPLNERPNWMDDL